MVGTVLLWLLAAPGCHGPRRGPGGETPGEQDGGPGPSGHDGGSGEHDAGPSACDLCADDQVCVDGACMAVPDSCPCPLGSYCDLEQNRCIVGCLGDDRCPADRYCDTATRTCTPGCRSDDDCPSAEVCADHECVNLCGDCDDGNSCTVDACLRGECTHEPGHEGEVCGEGASECTAGVCREGSCVDEPAHEGASCEAGPCVMNARCEAGACRGDSLPDGTRCGTGDFELCLAGECASVSALCANRTAPYDDYIYTEWEEPDGDSGTQFYYECRCSSSGDLEMNWPPDAVGSGGTPRYWSCRHCAATADDPDQLACWTP